MKTSTFTFRSLIEKDDNYFHGYVPSLPGVHTQGDSIEETRKNLKEAVLAYLEAQQILGEDVNKLINKEEYETIETISFPFSANYA